jgi:hypothetical protein
VHDERIALFARIAHCSQVPKTVHSGSLLHFIIGYSLSLSLFFFKRILLSFLVLVRYAMMLFDVYNVMCDVFQCAFLPIFHDIFGWCLDGNLHVECE